MGAPSRPIWTVVGLDPISGRMATHNNSCSSDNYLLFRTGVASATDASENGLMQQKITKPYCKTKFYFPKFR